MYKYLIIAVLCAVAVSFLVNYIPNREVLGQEGPTSFAKVDAAGNVLTVIVADQAFIDSGAVGDPAFWIPVDYKVIEKSAEIGGTWDWDKQKFVNKVESKTKKSADEKEETVASST